MRCTKTDCFARTGSGFCGILEEKCKKEPCPFFKTTDELKEQERKVKQRLKKLYETR